MTWAEDLLDCSYKGVAIEVMDEDLEAARALGTHGVPYVDGDDVEDLGRGSRQFDVRAVFNGVNYLLQLQAKAKSLPFRQPSLCLRQWRPLLPRLLKKPNLLRKPSLLQK